MNIFMIMNLLKSNVMITYIFVAFFSTIDIISYIDFMLNISFIIISS